MQKMRAAVMTVAVLGGVLALQAAPAAAQVHQSCATAEARVTIMQTHLTRVQQRIDSRNAKIADAGTDQALVDKLEARLTRAQRHHDRIAARIAKITKHCGS
jgi:hypothetical protein